MNELQLIHEISTWEYLASTLTQDHQQSVKSEILAKVESMKYKLSEKDFEVETGRV